MFTGQLCPSHRMSAKERWRKQIKVAEEEAKKVCLSDLVGIVQRKTKGGGKLRGGENIP